jgi:hypothetical protein
MVPAPASREGETSLRAVFDPAGGDVSFMLLLVLKS